ncbi:receptor-like protein EIX1 [Cornus florida]|uniref:receptor-like protein EIX1 n=1 Tax=Cornus florida TaxID=4283 RepID=UPI0028987745|nr:receptor-like protein EIX1 [Cornus florida]
MGRISIFYLIFAIISIITTEFACNGDANLTHCLESNREALIEFRNGLKDPENRLSSWHGSNCCQWWGIRCDNRTGAVAVIDLHHPNYATEEYRYEFWNLSGEIRPSLLKLESLTYLDLSYTTFQDIPIPEFFGSLKNLRYLNLSYAGFSGIIPPNLGNLSSLKYLDVSSEFSSLSVDNLQWMTGLVSLKHLEMNRVTLSLVGSSWIEVLNKFPFLTELHLSQCSLSGSISSLRSVNFTSLEVIDLNFNSFNSKFPDWLANLTSLVHVGMSRSALHGRIPLGLSELPSLRYLDLGFNDLSASCFQLFRGSWRKIEVLNFATNQLHRKLPSSIGNITFLTDIDLHVNNVDGGIPSSIGRLCNLKYFDFSYNNLTGSLPELLEGTGDCVSKSLLYLKLSNNRLIGKLPEWLGHLENLVELELGDNLLGGPIPASLGKLSELSILDVSSNHLTGTISEVHFAKLRKLKSLYFSSNSLILNVSSNWVPPFKVTELDMSSCHLGPSFPTWLESQRELVFLDLSNASISGAIPAWFWDITSSMLALNVSRNQLRGQLPNPLNVISYFSDFSFNLFEGPIPHSIVQIGLLDLSNNQFSGPIPQNITISGLIFLSISNNQLTGQIPSTIGEMHDLVIINLSWNNLTGSIPSSIGNCSSLEALDLGHNSLSGVIPNSLGQLKQIQSLHLNDNMLSGEVPYSFMNLSSLQNLDLGNNYLSGNILPLFGESFTDLRILRLRWNAFSGGIPTELSHLSSLQVLDLAHNNLTGTIPVGLGDLKAMAQENKVNQYLLYGYKVHYYEESLVVNMKGGTLTYTKTLSLVTSIDLSENNLNGDFPVDITKLSGLVALNLSSNQISGRIPENISSLRQLSSLDLSSNKLSGAIPPSMPSLTFLGYLNLSDNNFSGAIPYTGQMMTFSESAYAGNPGLCGPPLVVKCQGEDSYQPKNVENENGDVFIDKWFYLSVGLGFAVGLLAPYLIIATRKSWSDAYFSFVDKIVYRLPCVRYRGAIRKW